MKELTNELDNLLDEMNESILNKLDGTEYIGIAAITSKDLEKVNVSGKKINIKMIGLLTFSDDVTPELIRETIEGIKVRGKVKSSPDVHEALNELTII